eukprot:m.205489 g.205489  ORF g.205489 m.205489 type:complete len:585 (-) comp22957_c0_seq1:80-1834(-)
MVGPSRGDLERLKRLERSAYTVQQALASRPAVTQSVLCAGVPHLQRAHYSGVVEERSAKRWCGYPLCSNELAANERDRGSKYRIDRSRQVVYDATDLRNYCSRACAAASYHLSNQISELPLGIRPVKSFRVAKLTFLAHGHRQPHGPDAKTATNDAGRTAPKDLVPPTVPVAGAAGACTTDTTAIPSTDNEMKSPQDGLAITERSPAAPPTAPRPAPTRNAHALVEGYEPGTLATGASPPRKHVPMASVHPLPRQRDTTDGPDPWDGFEEGLAEMKRQEKEAEQQRIRAAMRPSILRPPSGVVGAAVGPGTDGGGGAPSLPGGNLARLGRLEQPRPGGEEAAVTGTVHPDHSAGPGSTIPRDRPDHPNLQAAKPSAFDKIKGILESWRTEATIALLSLDPTYPPWPQRLDQFLKASTHGSTRTAAGQGEGPDRGGADDGGEDTLSDPRLPAIDSRSQRRVRHAVLMDQLTAAAPAVLSFLAIPHHAVQEELRALTATLELHMDTVYFAPTEWLVITSVLLVALAGHVDVLRRAWGAPAPDADVGKDGTRVNRLEFWIAKLGLEAPTFAMLVDALRTPPEQPLTT